MINQLIFSIQVIVTGPPSQIVLPISVEILPALPSFKNDVLTVNASVSVNKIPLPLSDAIFNALDTIIGSKIENFFDDDRELKTLLNFGNDYQELITNWKYDASNDQSTINVKLYRPLTPLISVNQPLWITREISPPVIDDLHVIYSPSVGQKVYLRPPNLNVQTLNNSNRGVDTVTFRSLFTSSFFNSVSQTDPVINQWYTDNINSSELNVDYSDYRNFVFYSSAESRLIAFKNKLTLIENINSLIYSNSSSLAGTGSANITGTLSYPALQTLASEKTDLIRSFDGYEQFLYFNSASAYSSSLTTNDWDDQLYFHTDATWPKITGSIVSINTATNTGDVGSMSPNPTSLESNHSWYQNQVWIAQQYDKFNSDYLGNNLPEYIVNDANSEEFVRFFDLIAHQFDLIKLYIDHMTNIWDRQNDSELGLSADLVWNIAKSFGIDLPNQYAINNLVDYTIGQTGTVSPKVYHQIAAETWKRFLHNQIFLMKTKGTKTSLRALSNVYGILPTTLQIRETSTPSFAYTTGTFEVFEEQSNVLNFGGSEFVTLPWSSSALTTNTLELRFNTTSSVSGVLLNGENAWALTVNPLTGSWARVTLISGSTPTISSSYLPLLDGNFYNLMLRYNASGMQLQVKRAEADKMVYESSTQESSAKVTNVWFNPYRIHLGGSGSFFGAKFNGNIDEFRTWGETLTDTTFNNHVRYSGMYNGNTQTSSRDSLYIRLSFNIPVNLGSAPFTLTNESPYIRKSGVTGSLSSFVATGFPNTPNYPKSMTAVVRQVLRYTLNSGGSQFTTNKITIAAPPVLRYVNIDGSGSLVPVLSPVQSMVSYQSKKKNIIAANNTIGFFFSLADAINDSMIRSVGNVNIQDFIGDPADVYNRNYSVLDTLNTLYWTSYAYNYNINSFVDFVDNLLEPLFEQAKKLIPARAHLLSGIVHEPHILERAKTKNYPPGISAGTNTRNTKDTLNLQAQVIDYEPNEPVATYNTLDACFSSLTSSLHVSAINPQYSTTLYTTQSISVKSEYDTYTTTLSAVPSSSIRFRVHYYDDSTNLQAFISGVLSAYGVGNIFQLTPTQLSLLNGQIQAYKSPSTININSIYDATKKTYETYVTSSGIVNEILPYTNFISDIASYTYFNDSLSRVGINGYTQVRYKQEILTNRGNWIPGTAYSRNDFVLQVSSSLSSADTGNGNEFVCVTSNANFISYLPPYVDTANWRAQSYVNQSTLLIKKAILVNNQVSLAPTGSSQPGVFGYQPQHFRFTRDNRTRVLRGLWLGCSQDITTTSDGKPPVEEFRSVGDILVVRNSNDPIQPTDNQTGPILDVT